MFVKKNDFSCFMIYCFLNKKPKTFNPNKFFVVYKKYDLYFICNIAFIVTMHLNTLRSISSF